MLCLYLDCFAGISGDMFVGAMLDLGLSLELLNEELAKLGLCGYRLEAHSVSKCGLEATQFKVFLEGSMESVRADQDASLTSSNPHPHRPLSEILSLINRSQLSEATKFQSMRIFTRLGEAEAEVHGIPLENVHFHEVGALDAIVDIVSAAIAVELLKIEMIMASPLHVGSGMVQTSHGLYPIPAPATAKLVVGVPVYASEAKGELTTPTGAAIITTLATSFGPLPASNIRRIGHGAGTKDRTFPNVLRAILCDVAVDHSGSTRFSYQTGTSVVIEANIDDMNPQHYEPLMTHLLEAGAQDVTLSPLQMKKQRPGTMLQIVTDPDNLKAVLSIIFRESSTIGVRTYDVTRYMLPRAMITVTTAYGPIRVKVARIDGTIVNAMPEFDDCRALSEKTGVPIKKVTTAAAAAALAAV